MTNDELEDRFWHIHGTANFSCYEIALYTYLLRYSKSHNDINPFSMQTKQLVAILKVSRDTICVARERLNDAGLVGMLKGKGRGASAYLLIGKNITNLPLHTKFCCVGESDTTAACVGESDTKNKVCVDESDTTAICVGESDTKNKVCVDESDTTAICVGESDTKKLPQTPQKKVCVGESDTKNGHTTFKKNRIDNKNNTTTHTHSVARARNGGECGKGGGKKSVGKKNGKSESSLFTEKELDRSQPKGITTAQLASFTPPTLDEVRQCFSKRNAAYRLPDWETEAEIFYNYYDSQGWVKSNGRKVANWESLVGEWIMRKQKENNQTQQRHEQPPTYRRPTPDDIAAEEQRKLAERIRRRLATPAGAPGGDGGEADLPF